MNEAKKMQRLHQLSVKGETLTAVEQTALQNWYENLDREEELILNDSQPIQNAEELREQLADTTKQSVKISREIESLISQNTALRNENQSLKNSRKQSVILYE
ncbi:MAG: hypothetical protein H0X72_00170 [Acidobacteria bacterium]|jgi:uncharacterized protein (DUF3084 family)|nr:hypothetical protein [Acidobacteriota bacterium]